MVHFEDIIGYEEEKAEMQRLCDILKNKEKYERMGVCPPQAILLYGVPGVGKTLMAKALIDESGRKCYYCRKNRPDGEFVTLIQETFSEAAKNAPSIVFLDDMDKFAEDNLSEDSNKEEFAAIQSCMEDIKGKEVFVVATANDIAYIPDSLMRVGRFGRQIRFFPPKYEDTVKIIGHYLIGKKIDSSINAEMIADILCGKSCVVLENTINEAGIYAAFDNSPVITKEHLTKAILRVLSKEIGKANDPKRKSEIAYHEAGHALMSCLQNKKIGILTINQYGGSGGFCAIPDTNEKIVSYDDALDDLKVAIAGKAAFFLLTGKEDLGARSDIDQACESIRPAIEKNCAEGFAFGYPASTGCLRVV